MQLQTVEKSVDFLGAALVKTLTEIETARGVSKNLADELDYYASEIPLVMNDAKEAIRILKALLGS